MNTKWTYNSWTPKELMFVAKKPQQNNKKNKQQK